LILLLSVSVAVEAALVEAEVLPASAVLAADVLFDAALLAADADVDAVELPHPARSPAAMTAERPVPRTFLPKFFMFHSSYLFVHLCVYLCNKTDF